MSRCHWCLSPLTVRIALIGTLAIMACGPERPADSVQGTPPAARAGELVESAASAETDREPVIQLNPGRRHPVGPTGEDPFANFDLPDGGEAGLPVVRHALRIENGLTNQIIVAATAGAAPVVLDSLDPGDSVRLDLEAPAHSLELQWRTIDGIISGSRPIELLADSIQVVRIEAESASR
jgi:hypothetical protein